MARLLAIDYGSRRTGLAVTDTGQRIATGLTAVDTPSLFTFLQDYLDREEVEAFVVGYPLGLDGRSTHATSLVERFVAELRRRWPDRPVHLEDERYTSREAVEALVASGVKKKARRDKKLLDEVAATILLQRWLESRDAARPEPGHRTDQP